MHLVLQAREHLDDEGNVYQHIIRYELQFHSTLYCPQPHKECVKARELFILGDIGKPGNRLKSRRTGNNPEMVIIMTGLHPSIQIV